MRLRKGEAWLDRRLNLLGICCFDSGSEPAGPDYSALANASTEAAKMGVELGNRQLAENQRQYENNMAVAKPIIEKQTALMDQQIEQGNDYYNYSKETFRPIEQQLVDEVKNGTSAYDSNPAVRAAAEKEAERAAADVAAAQSSAQGQTTRALMSMGVNPNSGKFASANVAQGLSMAATKAGAMTDARDKAVSLDLAKRLDVVGLGRNLPSLSQGAYAQANSSGNSAVGNQTGVSAQYLNGMNAGNGLQMQGQGMQISGLSSALSGQQSAYNAAKAASAQEAAGLGSLLGGAIALSSKEVKTDKSGVDDAEVLDEVKNLPVEKWKYKDGVADGGEHIGPYAEDVRDSFGDKAAPGGAGLDLVTMNGISLASIKALARKTDKLERRVAGLVTKLADNRR